MRDVKMLETRLAILLVVGVAFGIVCLLAWVIQLVLGGFGVHAPYWGLVGALCVLRILLLWR